MPRSCSGLAVIGPDGGHRRRCRAARARTIWSVTPASSAAASQACGAGRGREDDRVDLAGGDRPDGGLDDGGVRAAAPSGTRRGCAPERPRRRTPRRARRRPRRGAAPRCPGPATPSSSSTSAISALVSDSATQSAVSPAAWIAPRALGPRATIRVPRSISTERLGEARARPRPRSSRGTRCPVVTTTVSGGSASSDRVPREQRARRRCAGPCSARGRAGPRPRGDPGRRRARPDRRSAVMSTTQPARVWSMGSLTGPL